MTTVMRILDEVGVIRQRTIAIYAEMAALTDAAAAGYTPRKPGAPDVTLELIRRALRSAPQQTQRILRQVVENDMAIARLVRDIADACPTCLGEGRVPANDYVYVENYAVPSADECPQCKGAGRVGDARNNPVYEDAERERDRQRAKGYDAAHDDAHTLTDFARFINDRGLAIRVHEGVTQVDGLDKQRRRFVEIMALAVAAIEKIDRMLVAAK